MQRFFMLAQQVMFEKALQHYKCWDIIDSEMSCDVIEHDGINWWRLTVILQDPTNIFNAPIKKNYHLPCKLVGEAVAKLWNA